MTSKLIFCQQLPKLDHLGSQILVIYDRKLRVVHKPIRKWLSQFQAIYPVDAGESLKELRHFPQHMAKILELTQSYSPRKLSIVVVGGGSVGDFGGFAASVFKRGVRLIQIPSTWLAAMDSAHGGKNALNVDGYKNQLGTFYFAEEIYLVKKLLYRQPEQRAREAFGELAKMAFLDGKNWSLELARERAPSSAVLWRSLKSVISSKNKIVDKDPCEKKGARQILNLGHTMGHILESAKGVAHGEAVAQGLYFTLKWSLQRGYISPKEYFRCVQLLSASFGIPCWVEQNTKWRKVPQPVFKRLLFQDKKRSSREKVNFVFLRKWGEPFLQAVHFGDLIEEARRQGWVG